MPRRKTDKHHPPIPLAGFAFPVWNNVDAAKHLFFNEKSHLVQNFAVNLS